MCAIADVSQIACAKIQMRRRCRCDGHAFMCAIADVSQVACAIADVSQGGWDDDGDQCNYNGEHNIEN